MAVHGPESRGLVLMQRKFKKSLLRNKKSLGRWFRGPLRHHGQDRLGQVWTSLAQHSSARLIPAGLFWARRRQLGSSRGQPSSTQLSSARLGWPRSVLNAFPNCFRDFSRFGNISDSATCVITRYIYIHVDRHLGYTCTCTCTEVFVVYTTHYMYMCALWLKHSRDSQLILI